MSPKIEPVDIKVYTWSGQWGPFRIKVSCGECSLTKDIIQDVCTHVLADIPTEISYHPWLDHWWRVLPKGGWHAPIVLVNGCVVSQGDVIHRDRLVEAVVKASCKDMPLKGGHLFGKDTCPFCMKAKTLLQEHKLDFSYRNVIQDQRSLWEMLARVKPIIGHHTPVTVPQVFFGEEYIGTYDHLVKFVEKKRS